MAERMGLRVPPLRDAVFALRARRSCTSAIVVGALVFALGVTIALPPHPLLVWNVTPSAPIGLYAIGPVRAVAVGDSVIAHVPRRWRTLAAERRYIPSGIPLVKQVAAGTGDVVCAVGRDILVNGRLVARRRVADARGRAIPSWEGCIDLRDGAVLLLMDNPDSFDGRYFGPTERRDILGRAGLLWAR